MTERAGSVRFSPRLRTEMILRTRAAPAVPALTLLDVIEAIHESTSDDTESTAVLRALLRSGTVRHREPGR